MIDTLVLATKAVVSLAVLYCFLVLVFRAYFNAKLEYVYSIMDLYLSLRPADETERGTETAQ